MTFSFEIPLLILLILTAGGAILVKDLVPAVFILGSELWSDRLARASNLGYENNHDVFI